MVTSSKTLSPHEEALLASIFQDDLAFISQLMSIPTKQSQGTRVKFVPWPVQRKLIDGLTGRDIVVKDSQIGCTSIVTALYLKRTITTPDTTTVIVAHEDFLTQRLLHRAQVLYDSIPVQLKPPMDHASSYEKRFPDINSVMYIGTARSMVFGRGEPIHNVLFSEEAFYVPDAHNRIVTPLLQRVPSDGSVIRESTPNGEQGAFHNEVQKARKKQSVFKLHNLYWWENPDNSIEKESIDYYRLVDAIDQEYAEVEEYSAEEQVLVDNHGITRDQIRWRRYKTTESPELFHQEHLEDLEKCFLLIEEPYYDVAVAVAATEKCHKATHAGPEGAKVWFKPEPGGDYVIGIDPGQGKITESVAHVWRADLDHPRHEATLHGFYEPLRMSKMCETLGRWYNNALLVPEANSHGLGLVERLMEPPRYPRVYMRRQIIKRKTTTMPGWLTGPSTKPYMLQELSTRLDQLECYDAEFWRQVRGCRSVTGGRVEFITADDHHDAGALSILGLKGFKANKQRGYKGGSGWEW